MAAGVTYGRSSGDVAGAVPGVLGAAFAQLPAIWVLGAVAAVLAAVGLVGVRHRDIPVG